MGTSFENGISLFWGLWWELLEIMPISSIWKTGFPFFWACDGNLWKIISISSIWKRDFRCFFLACDSNLWKIISIIFYLKTEFPCFFWACDGNLIWKRDFRVFLGFSGKSCQYLLFENGISLFLGLWWEPLENNANIFYLKTEFPCFFLGLWWEPHLKTGFPCLFGLFWKIMPISSIWKRDFPFLGLVMGTSGK